LRVFASFCAHLATLAAEVAVVVGQTQEEVIQRVSWVERTRMMMMTTTKMMKRRKILGFSLVCFDFIVLFSFICFHTRHKQ
jgi:hypothetical protein